MLSEFLNPFSAQKLEEKLKKLELSPHQFTGGGV